MVNIPVIEQLSALPPIITECSPFAAIVSLPTGTYFTCVILIFTTKVDDMLYFSTFDAMSWRYRNSISFQAQIWMYFLRALIFPFLAACFCMLYLSFSDHLCYWSCLFTNFAHVTWFFLELKYWIKYKNNSFVIVLKIKSFITVIITNFLQQHGKSYICCHHCKRILLMSKVFATKRKQKTYLSSRAWKCLR